MNLSDYWEYPKKHATATKLFVIILIVYLKVFIVVILQSLLRQNNEGLLTFV
jgi:hypothetical protein